MSTDPLLDRCDACGHAVRFHGPRGGCHMPLAWNGPSCGCQALRTQNRGQSDETTTKERP